MKRWAPTSHVKDRLARHPPAATSTSPQMQRAAPSTPPPAGSRGDRGRCLQGPLWVGWGFVRPAWQVGFLLCLALYLSLPFPEAGPVTHLCPKRHLSGHFRGTDL